MHMKQFFTLVVCTLLAGLSTLRAEIVTAYVTDENNVEYNDVTMGLTYSDGVFTLWNFCNVGTTSPLSFKFNQDMAVNSESAVTFVGDNVVAPGGNYEYYRFKNENGTYSKGAFWKGNTKLVVRYAGVYNDGTSDYTYIMRLDKERYGYDYYAYFCTTGVDENNDWLPWYDYEFYFNIPETTESLGDVDVSIYDDNEKEAAKGYKSELTVTPSGVYTLVNFIDSGASLSFTFDSNVQVGKYTKVVPTGDVEEDSGFYDILTAKSSYPVGKLYALSGNGVTDVKYPYVYADAAAQYSYVTKLDKAEYGYEYYASFNFSGYDADNGYLDDYYLEFYFNSKPSGVATVAVDDENAPVEYYNLNGQRVLNPENGLFIRKQGSKVSKVIIR